MPPSRCSQPPSRSAGSDRLGPRVEEVWVWKLKMRRLMLGARLQLKKTPATIGFYGFYMMFIGLYMFCSIKNDHEVVCKASLCSR